jgi:hypothetical protein
MPTDDNQRDIEIIPPGDGRRQDNDAEWVAISFESGARAFKKLPLHKRILVATGWLAGVIALGLIVFLIIASAVLIWIPLLLATILIASLFVLFRRSSLRWIRRNDRSS